MRVAVTGSCATARMPRPNLVALMKRSVMNASTRADEDDDDLDVGDRGAEDAEHVDGLDEPDRLLGVDAAELAVGQLREHEVHELLDDERGADGGDEEDERGCAALAQRPVGHPLEPDRGAARDDHAADQGDAEVEDRHRDALVVRVPARREAEQHEGPVHAEHAEHEDLGVREVDEAQHAVDERVADGDEGVDRAVGQAVDGECPEVPSQGAEVEPDHRVGQDLRAYVQDRTHGAP